MMQHKLQVKVNQTHTENNEVTNDKITIKLEMENKIASIPYYYIGRDPFGK